MGRPARGHGRGAHPAGRPGAGDLHDPGHDSVRTAWLCRDKPSMKQALREAGVPTAASTAAAQRDEVHAFADAVGYPLILKPRNGAGAAGHDQGRRRRRLDAGSVHWRRRRLDRGRGVRRRPRGLLRHAGRRRAGRGWTSSPLLPERARSDANPLDLAAVHRNQPDRHPSHTSSCARWASTSLPHSASGRRHPHGVVRRREGPALLRDRMPAPGVGVWDLYCRQRLRPSPSGRTRSCTAGVADPSRRFAAGMIAAATGDGRRDHRYSGVEIRTPVRPSA